MITTLPMYVISIDNTLTGKSSMFATNSLAEAQDLAEKRIRRLKHSNIVIKSSRDGEVISYYEN